MSGQEPAADCGPHDTLQSHGISVSEAGPGPQPEASLMSAASTRKLGTNHSCNSFTTDDLRI